MTHQEILKSLQQKIYRPVYFLHGEEPFFIDLISNYIESNVLEEAEKSFNQTILYGKETDHLTVLDNARRYPMMSPYQVVILKEAQEMRDLEELTKYLEKPLDSTILVIAYKHKSYNKFNGKFGRLLREKAVILESKKLYDNQVADWIIQYMKAKNYQLAANVAALIAEYLGTDLSKIVNELEKICLNVPAGATITLVQVEENIGISREFNIYELQSALAAKDIGKTMRIVQHFAANERKNPLVLIIGSLSGFFTKLYMLHFVKNRPEAEILKTLDLRSAWFLKDYTLAAKQYNLAKTESILQLLKEYDLRSKGVETNTTNIPEGALLKELAWKILH
ncbi:MAG TPA: DNA polymerase III subunit delta [Saprospiraceae bacterium]|nr:DNA polymerase III subunit delta [Saprospiraceae bacterium]